MRIHLFFIFCLLLAVNSSAYTNELAPKIIYVYDGDTVKIRENQSEYKLRLADIDAPERNQSYGKASRRALIQLCKNAEVKVYITGVDKYHRNVGNLMCNNQDASIYMVKSGHAWFYKRYSMNYTLDVMEQESRAKSLGLWKRKNPTPPWQWRQKHRH